MIITLYGVCALTFMMAMYALEARHRRFVAAFALGCLLSSIYGFLSNAWPFGVVEAIWTVVALRRYQATSRGQGGPVTRTLHQLAELAERARNLIALAAAVATPFGAAAALIPARGTTPNATVALALAVLVSLLATTGTRATAALAAVSASLGFDLFHTRPYGSLTITHPPDIETTALLLTVSLIVGQLAARNRRHRQLAAQTSYDLGRVHAVAEMVAGGEPVDQVVVAVANELTDLLRLRSCRFDPSFAERPGPFIERHGALTWGALRWGFNTTGLPSHEVSLIVQHQGLPLGRYVLLAVPGTRVSADQLIAAVALADQVGAALAAQGTPE